MKTTGNYIPSPIERLTTHSVEQQMLDALLRIENLLLNRFGPAITPGAAVMTVETPAVSQQETQTPAPKGRGRFGGRK